MCRIGRGARIFSDEAYRTQYRHRSNRAVLNCSAAAAGDAGSVRPGCSIDRWENRRSGWCQLAKDIIKNSGYNEISLMSLSSADYSCLPELVDQLLDAFKDQKVSVSLPSLRIDSFSIDIAKKVQQVRKSGLTLAPEAGTQRLRDVINKGVTEENLMQACENAFKNGWSTVKLYFMMGLPTETDEVWPVLPTWPTKY